MNIGSLVCSLRSDLNNNCKMWDVTVVAEMVGVTTGFGSDLVRFEVEFGGVYDPVGFEGEARLLGISLGAVGPVGAGLASIRLGQGEHHDNIPGLQDGAWSLPGIDYVGGQSTLSRVRELSCQDWE